MTKTTNLENDPRSISGRKDGFGCCRECNGTWNWKFPFIVPIKPGRSKFVICRDCAHKMADSEILDRMKVELVKSYGAGEELRSFLEYAELAIKFWRAHTCCSHDDPDVCVCRHLPPGASIPAEVQGDLFGGSHV